MILIQPSIDPVIFSFSFIQIRWYGMAYLAAFVIGIYLIKQFNNKLQSNLIKKNIDDFFVWAVIGVIIGGRVGYVFFYQINNFIDNPYYILEIWKGGMSFHGGLIGIIISILIFTRKHSLNFYQMSDLVSLVAPIGLFLGRISNFINGELYGRVTNIPFAIINPAIDLNPRHPSQLYEAFFEGLILFIITIIVFNKFYYKKKFGIVTGIFLIFYGTMRFILEFLREPDIHIGLFFNFITMGQILCIPIMIFGFLIYYKKND